MGIIDIMVRIIDHQFKEMQSADHGSKYSGVCKYRFESTIWAISSIIRTKPITINRSNDKAFQLFS